MRAVGGSGAALDAAGGTLDAAIFGCVVTGLGAAVTPARAEPGALALGTCAEVGGSGPAGSTEIGLFATASAATASGFAVLLLVSTHGGGVVHPASAPRTIITDAVRFALAEFVSEPCGARVPSELANDLERVTDASARLAGSLDVFLCIFID
jgi:hypothetical protein